MNPSMNRKAPNSKHQAPEKHQAPNIKRQAAEHPGGAFEVWDLELLWSLVLGAWSLVLSGESQPVDA
jgi:hypothetical protein